LSGLARSRAIHQCSVFNNLGESRTPHYFWARWSGIGCFRFSERSPWSVSLAVFMYKAVVLVADKQSLSLLLLSAKHNYSCHILLSGCSCCDVHCARTPTSGEGAAWKYGSLPSSNCTLNGKSCAIAVSLFFHHSLHSLNSQTFSSRPTQQLSWLRAFRGPGMQGRRHEERRKGRCGSSAGHTNTRQRSASA
jgi:hypothetical protein